MAGWSLRGAVAALAIAGAPATAQSTTGDGAAPHATPSATTGDTQHRAPSGVAQATDQSPSALAGDTRQTPPPGLVGDWLDIRKRLADRGIGITARYASEAAYNVTGGSSSRIAETGQFDVGVLFDLEQTIGLKGGAFQATLTYRRGDDLGTVANLGTLQQVQEVYGRGQTLRLTQFWYEQRVGERLEIKVGRTDPGEDFAAFSCHFQNLSFCGAQPGNLVGDYWQNWPVGQWGARAKVDLGGHFYVQAAAYEVNPRNLNRAFVFGYFHGATGVLVPVEAGWVHGGDDGHVGSYKVGGWYTSAPGSDVYLDVNRQPIAITGAEPLQHSARYGVYLNMQQQLTGGSKNGKSTGGLSVFANVTQADRATTANDNQVAVGAFYKGLVPWIPGDVLGLAFARTAVNGRVAAGEAIDPTHPAIQTAEYAEEVYYSIHPLDWLELRPNLQLIHHPGGLSTKNDVSVVGLKTAITF